MHFIKNLGTFLLDLIYPPFCCGCQRYGTYLCPHCYQTIDFIPMPLSVQLDSTYLEHSTIVARYTGVIKKLITTCKYHSVIGICPVLAQLIWYTTTLPTVDGLTFVPITRQTVKKRGFNQAEQICQHLSQISGIPYYPTLKKIKNTPRQAAVADKESRLTNLQDCFSIDQQFLLDYKKSTKKITSLLIIDDVTTTGTTLNECAKVLQENGIEHVYGLTIAHGY